MGVHFDNLARLIPELFAPEHAPASILYVGAHHKETTLVPELKAVGHSLTLLELVPNWAKRFMRGGMSESMFKRVYIGDVRNVQSMDISVHDVVVWWHGPEHIELRQLSRTTANLEDLASKLVVMACPFGYSKMYRTKIERATGAKDPKRSQFHLAQLYPEHFARMGYHVHTTGERDGIRRNIVSHILAWKWMTVGNE